MYQKMAPIDFPLNKHLYGILKMSYLNEFLRNLEMKQAILIKIRASLNEQM